MNNNRKFSLAFVITLIVGAFILIFVLNQNASSSPKPSTTSAPINLIGHWHQVNKGIDGNTLKADISDGQISIDLKTVELGNAQGLFWEGTFDTTKSANSTFKLTSVGNRNDLDLSMFSSSEKTKWFAYDHGDLTFQFSILDKSTIIHMQKG